MSLTTDPKDPRLKEGQNNESGQHEIYLVLSEEERSKGFVRPVRNTYVHVGRRVNYKGIHYMLEGEELQKWSKIDPAKSYVAVMTTLTKEDGSFLGGPFVTQEELDAWKEGKTIGGCGSSTTMGEVLSETYARNPKFYSATYCCECQKHLPVEEFVWEGTNETVGS